MRMTLDHIAHTKIRVFLRDWPSFQVCGYTGLVFAIVLGLFVVCKTGLSLWVISVISVAAMATFLMLAFATKVITGEEQLIYYHHEIAIMLVSALVATLLHRPALPYLDVTILGVGTFLAFGRIGCLMVGCCHGRPCSWGICYRSEHAREGFADYLVGVRLFPIQALESFFVFAFVIAGTAAVLRGQPAGTAFALYTIGYGSVRFGFEFFRGDSDRPYTLGFSQGQWLSLWLMTGVAGAELSGRMPIVPWHLKVVFATSLVMLTVTLWRRLDRARRFAIQHPHHVGEIARVLNALEAISHNPKLNPDFSLQVVPVASTSLGLQISMSQTSAPQISAASPVRSVVRPAHYTISFANRRIDTRAAETAAALIRTLKPDSECLQLIAGRESGVVHLVARNDLSSGLVHG